MGRRSNTPLQALPLLIDRAYHDSAEALGERCQNEAKDDAGRIRRLLGVCLGREPPGRELKSVCGMVDRRRVEG